MPKYLAITIGPITRTLNQTKKTRELWGASFLFSYISRGIIRELINGNILRVATSDIFNPGRSDHFDMAQKGAGLYPDRIMVQLSEVLSKEEAIGKISLVINNVIEGLTNKISEPGVNEMLRKYLRVYCTVAKLENGENIFRQLNAKLAVLELQERLDQPWDDRYSVTAFTDDANGAVFLKDAFKGYGTDFTFPSLPEISSVDLREYREQENTTSAEWLDAYNKIADNTVRKYFRGRNKARKGEYKDEGKSEDTFIEQLKSEKTFRHHFKAYHKYYCIVHADGDAVGTVLSAFGDRPDILREFTSQLFQYALKAIDEIKAYGGTTVYAGGDDLLFFAPVVSWTQEKGGQSIFALIDRIDAAFLQLVRNFKTQGFKLPVIPTLSFGLSIAYYKYPLSEALTESRNQLVKAAKGNRYKISTATVTQSKNSVAFRLFKHSGRGFGAVWGKDTASYSRQFSKMLTINTDEDNFFSSAQYKLHVNKAVIESVLAETDATQRTISLSNFFDNNFNESVHIRNKNFIDAVRDFILSAFEESITSGHSLKVTEVLDKVYAALRFVHFINQPGNE